MLRALFLKTSQQFTEKSPVKLLLQTISYKTACNFSVISHQLPFNSSELWCKFPPIRYFLSNEYLCSILKEMKHKVYYKEKDKLLLSFFIVSIIKYPNTTNRKFTR